VSVVIAAACAKTSSVGKKSDASTIRSTTAGRKRLGQCSVKPSDLSHEVHADYNGLRRGSAGG
jgi:hypothetical protein